MVFNFNIWKIIYSNIQYTFAICNKDTCLFTQNEKNQIMKSNVWLRLVWNDYQLQWDEADYGGISVLRLPPDKVWKPDIVLFNK